MSLVAAATRSAPCLVDVRESTRLVMSMCEGTGSSSSSSSEPNVRIDETAIELEITSHPDHYGINKLPPSWAADYHFTDGTDRTAQYVLVLDSINFCFWPIEGYEYSDLAGSLRLVLLADPTAFNADALASLSESTLERWLQPPPNGHFWTQGSHPIAVERRAIIAAATAAADSSSSSASIPPPPIVPIPLLTQRTRAIREVGSGLIRFFHGETANLIRDAGGDASRLVELVTATFPAFRDETIYKGMQIFLYKRAQIFVGDIWGAYGGKGLGSFHNISDLTCFADYRVPQLLRSLGIMVYSADVCELIDAKKEIPVQSEVEIELRAATIQSVERMVLALSKRGIHMMPFQLDWLLWERGEAMLSKLKPHHRTLTIFY